MVWRKLGDLYLERVTLAKATKRRNDESDENEHAPIGQLAPSSACPLVCLSARLFVCSLNCDKYDEYDNNDETTKRTCPHKAVSSLIRSSACLLVCLSVCLFVCPTIHPFITLSPNKKSSTPKDAALALNIS